MNELAFLQGRVEALEALCLALARAQKSREILKTSLGVEWKRIYGEILAGDPLIAYCDGVQAVERRLYDTIGSFPVGTTPSPLDGTEPDPPA